jgi:hypothetical protein
MPPDLPPRWLAWSALRPLFRGVGQRLLLVGPILLILLIAAGRLGGYFGVPELFWHQDPLKQALGGLAVALLFAEICLVSFLLDAPKPWLKELPEDAPDNWHRGVSRVIDGVLRVLIPQPRGADVDVRQWRQLRWYLSVTWLPLLVPLKVLALWRPSERWSLLVGLAAGVLVIGAVVWAFQHLNAGHINERLQELARKLPRPAVTGSILGGVFVGLMTLAWLLPGTRVVVIFALGLWVMAAGGYCAAVRFEDVEPEQRWVHGLAATVFGLVFLTYEALFIVVLAVPLWSALVLPPAVAMCLLLTVMVAGHGYLKFHFGGWYTVLAFAVLALAVAIGGFTSHRHQLRGLDYDEADLLDLEGSDFQMEAAEANDPKLLARLTSSYRRLFQRFGDQRKLVGPKLVVKEEPAQPPDKFADVKAAREAQQVLRKAMRDLERTRLDNWAAAATQGKGGKPKLVLISVTGGANRSGLWTAATLTRLERDLAAQGIDFPAHVRVITGASGGMVGASYYVATLRGPGGHGFQSDDEANAFVRKAGQDALTPVSHRFLFFDLPGVFVPGGTSSDRGLALEQAWAKYLDESLESTFEQLAPGEAAGWRPSLVLSPMQVEDGRRVLFSNLYLGPLIETSGAFLTEEEIVGADAKEAKGGKDRPKAKFTDRPRYSVTGLEFFQMFPQAWGKLPLATAVRLNASFPFVSPTGAIPTKPPRHLVDAGYYDNYGVNLAAWWLYHNYGWIQENTSGVVLIQIRDAVSERTRLTPLEKPGTPAAPQKVWGLAQALESITGPAVGASNALQSTMSFRNDELLQVLDDWFNNPDASDVPFTTVVFEFPGEIAMSWYLSDAEIERTLQPFESGSPNERALLRLRAWLKR